MSVEPAALGPASERSLVRVWGCLDCELPFQAVPASPHQRIASACAVAPLHSADQQLQIDIIKFIGYNRGFFLVASAVSEC